MTSLQHRSRSIFRIAVAVPTLAVLPQFAFSQEASSIPPPLEAETVGVATLPAAGPHTLYVSSGFRGNALHVLNANNTAIAGTLYVSGSANVRVAPENELIYVADSMWSRGNRGKRSDFLSVYDGSTLNLLSEISLPGRLISTPKSPNFVLNASGTRGFILNMEPASSVIVVDLQKRKVLSSIETPGCGMIYPWGGGNFTSLCADGSLATVAVDEKGKGSLKRSKPFFDAVHDPIFEESAVNRKTDEALFMSYTGMIYPVILSDDPKFQEPWSLQQAAGLSKATTDPEQETWRPGGRQLMALHERTGRLFVAMHEGRHWSQRVDGTEIWVFDVNEHRLLKRYSVPQSVQDILVTQDDKPYLYCQSNGWLWVLDPNTGDVIRAERGVGGGLLASARS